tara:strand:- start:785 stop:1480 length:696 start_codon:yes stop_codon:yes gene_type:complete
MRQIKPTGTYYNIIDDNVTREIKPVPKQTQLICDAFLNGLSLDEVHSVYIKGSMDLTYDIDFSILSDSMSDDTTALEKHIFDEFGVELDCIVNNREGFDLYERFRITCIYGQDISLRILHRKHLPVLLQEDIDSIKLLYEWLSHYLDEDHPLILKNYRQIIKLILRNTFLTTKLDVYTRDLYYCQKFISQKYPCYSDLTHMLLQAYLDGDIKRYVLNSCQVLLRHLENCLN